jgi:hypothetical protein
MIRCEGKLPVQNCRYGIEKIGDGGEKSFLCESCEINLMPDDNYKNCIPTTIQHCLETLNIKLAGDQFKKVCVSCAPGYIPSVEADKCLIATKTVENCLVYTSLRFDRKNDP